MGSKYKYGFNFNHDKAWAWHLGLFFCIEPKWEDGKRDIYIFIGIGNHDFSIGMMHTDEECPE